MSEHEHACASIGYPDHEPSAYCICARCGERFDGRAPAPVARAASGEGGECECPPCPGRGNDGHGLTHCAECCYGSGVEADPGCPIHGEAALARAASGTTGEEEGT